VQGGIFEIFFPAAVIESDFHYPAGYCRICEWQVGQPIMHIESVATTCAAASVAFATARFTIFSTT
jgi:hypothetical protein